jgi:uncharacterized protein
MADGGCGQAQTPPMMPDIPAKFVTPVETYDYIKHMSMIPMRDGAKLLYGDDHL